MEARSKQHRDVPEGYAFFTQLQNLLTDEAGLHLFALCLDQNGGLTLVLVRKQSLVVTLLGALDDVVGQIKNGLGAAVVFFKFDDASFRKGLGEIHDVAEIGAAKGKDALGIIPQNGDVVMGCRQRPNNLRLEIVGVLVLIDHDKSINVRKTAAYLFLMDEEVP